MNNKIQRKLKRQTRIRAKVKGTQDRPRLSVFRSSKYMYAQIIDDEKMETLVGVSEKNLKEKATGIKKIERAKKLGLLLAELALGKKITKVVFDKGDYLYHGRVEAVASGAREGGLSF